MRRLSLAVCLLAALLLVLLAGPSVASETQADGAPPAAGNALAAEVAPGCGTPNRSTDTLFGTPDPAPATGCTAEVTCWGGDTVSCTGTTRCHEDCGSVLCDDTWIECTCEPPLACPGWETAYCNCRSCGGTHNHCYRCWCISGGTWCY